MPTKCAAPLFNRRVACKSMPHFSEMTHEMASAAGLRLAISKTCKRIEMVPIVCSTRLRGHGAHSSLVCALHFGWCLMHECPNFLYKNVCFCCTRSQRHVRPALAPPGKLPQSRMIA